MARAVRAPPQSFTRAQGNEFSRVTNAVNDCWAIATQKHIVIIDIKTEVET